VSDRVASVSDNNTAAGGAIRRPFCLSGATLRG